MREGQRPVLIPAQGNALGLRFKKSQGLKARLNPAGDKSGLQPSAILHKSPWGVAPGWNKIAPLALVDFCPRHHSRSIGIPAFIALAGEGGFVGAVLFEYRTEIAPDAVYALRCRP